jgi:hypothetical protein
MVGVLAMTASAQAVVKHKGAKTYVYCGTGIGGCSAELVVYAKNKTYEWYDPIAGFEAGVVETELVGKAKYTLFRSTTERTAGCVMRGLKTKTGYNSEAKPGEFVCNGRTVESWYAHK